VLSLFQWYNQRAQQQQTGGTLVCKISTQCLGDLNQPECFCFLTNFCHAFFSHTHTKKKKGRKFLEKINYVVVVVVVIVFLKNF
jgi:hypothetical protein